MASNVEEKMDVEETKRKRDGEDDDPGVAPPAKKPDEGGDNNAEDNSTPPRLPDEIKKPENVPIGQISNDDVAQQLMKDAPKVTPWHVKGVNNRKNIVKLTLQNAYKKGKWLDQFDDQNIRYLTGRHYARCDGYMTTRWDQHPWTVKTYMAEGIPLCGVDPEAKEEDCDYCKDMTDQARKHRREHCEALRKKGELSERKGWGQLPHNIRTNVDAQRRVEASGHLFEYVEDENISSKITTKKVTENKMETGSQTEISTLVRGPHPYMGDIVNVNELPEYAVKIFNPNVETERFISYELAKLYKDKMRVCECGANDPSQYAPKLTRPELKELHDKEERRKLFARRVVEVKRDPGTANVENQDHVIRTATGETIPVSAPRGEIFGDYWYDGGWFDPSDYTDEELCNYHEWWASTYRQRMEETQRLEQMSDVATSDATPTTPAQPTTPATPVDPVKIEPGVEQEQQQQQPTVIHEIGRITPVFGVNVGASTSRDNVPPQTPQLPRPYTVQSSPAPVLMSPQLPTENMPTFRIPMHLRWKYEERYERTVEQMCAMNNTIVPLKACETAHPCDRPKTARRSQRAAGIQLDTDLLWAIDTVVTAAYSHLSGQTVNDIQQLNVDPPSQINSASYNLKGSMLPICTYINNEFDNDNVELEAANVVDARWTLRDVHVMEQYVKCLVNVVNFYMTQSQCLAASLKELEEQLSPTTNVLLDAQRDVEEELRLAVAETLVHQVLTRRLRTLSPSLNKDVAVNMLTRPLTATFELFPDNDNGTNILCI